MANAARSLPPLSFDDPSLDVLEARAPANDTHSPLLTEAQLTLPSLTFASEMPPPMASAPKAPAALAYPIPSYIPEALPDPSFAPVTPRAPSSPRAELPARTPRPAGPVKLPALQPAPHDPSLEDRVIDALERALEAVPSWPAALRVTVPLAVTVALSLAAFVYEIGFTIRTARAAVTALSLLGS
jgi:hypothetical protein